MTSLAGKENVRADVVGAAASHLEALFASHAVERWPHGILHARAVRPRRRGAAAAARPLPAERALAVRLAALLHDADDKKYFGKASAASLANARRILGAVGAAPAVVDDVARMIHWVSCSANGNACPEPAAESPELLWPRWADRLEAAGEVGVARCYLHNLAAGDPLCVPARRRGRGRRARLALATEERFAAYQASVRRQRFHDRPLRRQAAPGGAAAARARAQRVPRGGGGPRRRAAPRRRPRVREDGRGAGGGDRAAICERVGLRPVGDGSRRAAPGVGTTVHGGRSRRHVTRPRERAVPW